MTPVDTEQGRMNIWDKALTAAFNAGKDVDQAIHAADRAVDAFEERFHADWVKAKKELGAEFSKATSMVEHVT